MRKIHVIGIGAGDPDQLTLQAVKALRSTDVFFVLDKGEVKSDLTRLRRDMLEAHMPEGASYRIVEARDPERDRGAGGAAYSPAVGDWRSARAGIYERLIAEELGEGQSGAFLVWGDPALYDSTIAILDEVLERGGVAFEYDVVPGISSVAALVARHRTGLNRVARPVQITTGRRLSEGFPEGVDDVVVMLDAHQAFRKYADQDIDIYWGAYIGTPDEILVSGPIAEAAPRIERLRAEARERKGWIMDTYLLRRHPGER
ncbi:precorrin-6A synthase (deacetylating) [Streptomyces sp. NPDC001260]|uniref:Precorrin-6A synthase (Deacetylating) n=1 Tax=Streptomyces gilvifuscus TaxID=1550617 RepID=A0ABT5FNC8_9ACTN|nr:MULTISPECIES: precorrin-6A synthase (deacetylating) [Streptomyces]MBK3643434.1 precorrin-6A synthase (deacetylating) [Streptomyces sp. MBT33]MDC2953987.1 precorrin-6A synthase (deacetylating) [Streptomyces gilvifuscus]